MMKGGRGFDVLLLLLYKTTTYPKTQRRGVGEYGIRPKLIKYVFYSNLFYILYILLLESNEFDVFCSTLRLAVDAL